MPATRDRKRNDPHCCWPLLPDLLFFSSSSSDFWPLCNGDGDCGPSGQSDRKTSKPSRRLRHSGTASLLAASALPWRDMNQTHAKHFPFNITARIYPTLSAPNQKHVECKPRGLRSCCCPCGHGHCPSLLCRLPVISHKLTARIWNQIVSREAANLRNQSLPKSVLCKSVRPCPWSRLPACAASPRATPSVNYGSQTLKLASQREGVMTPHVQTFCLHFHICPVAPEDFLPLPPCSAQPG